MQINLRLIDIFNMFSGYHLIYEKKTSDYMLPDIVVDTGMYL